MAASSVVELFRIALLVSLLLESAHPYNFLLSHPFYGASHVLTLRAVTENLLGRSGGRINNASLLRLDVLTVHVNITWRTQNMDNLRVPKSQGCVRCVYVHAIYRVIQQVSDFHLLTRIYKL